MNFNTATQNNLMEINDSRLLIVKNYAKGWFMIDLMSIIPFELFVQVFMKQSIGSKEAGDLSDEASKMNPTEYNRFIRISRISKLYKLVKITRLLRVFKLMQSNSIQNFKKFGSKLNIGAGIEKLVYFFLILLLMCHFISCIWIFAAK